MPFKRSTGVWVKTGERHILQNFNSKEYEVTLRGHGPAHKNLMEAVKERDMIQELQQTGIGQSSKSNHPQHIMDRQKVVSMKWGPYQQTGRVEYFELWDFEWWEKRLEHRIPRRRKHNEYKRSSKDSV